MLASPRREAFCRRRGSEWCQWWHLEWVIVKHYDCLSGDDYIPSYWAPESLRYPSARAREGVIGRTYMTYVESISINWSLPFSGM